MIFAGWTGDLRHESHVDTHTDEARLAMDFMGWGDFFEGVWGLWGLKVLALKMP